MLARLQKFENFISYSPSFFKWGIATLLLAIPLYPKFPIFNVPGTYVAIRAEDFIIAILFSVYLLFVLKNYKNFFEDRLNQAIFLFIIIGLISLIAGVFLTQTVSAHIGFLHWARRVEYIIPFFIAASFVRSNARFFVEILYVAAFLVFVYGFGQIYLHFPVISTQNDEFSKGLALQWVPGARLHSTFAGHYDLSAWLVMFFPFAIAWLFYLKNWLTRGILSFCVIVPCFWLFMRAESRVSFLAFLIGVTATLFLVRKKSFIIPFLVISILGMLTVGNLWGKYRNTVDIYKGKILHMIKTNAAPTLIYAQDSVVAPQRIRQSTPEPKQVSIVEDRSTSIRLNVEWPRAVRALEKNPILGTGYSSITLATDNDYLRILGEIGILGAAAFLLVLTRIAKSTLVLINKARVMDVNSVFLAGFWGAFVGILINASFIDIFEASKVAIVFWTLAGAAIGITKELKIEKV